MVYIIYIINDEINDLGNGEEMCPAERCYEIICDAVAAFPENCCLLVNCALILRQVLPLHVAEVTRDYPRALDALRFMHSVVGDNCDPNVFEAFGL